MPRREDVTLVDYDEFVMRAKRGLQVALDAIRIRGLPKKDMRAIFDLHDLWSQAARESTALQVIIAAAIVLASEQKEVEG